MDRWFVVALEVLGLVVASVAVVTLSVCLVKVLKEVWKS